MTFYGESHGLDWGVNVSGSPVSTFTSLTYHFDGTQTVISAGQSFTVGIMEDALNATPTDEMILSWAIECGPGSNGTLRLADGVDPDWSYTAAVCTSDKGEHPVTGAQVVVVPAAITREQYFNIPAGQGEATLLVECVTGSVEILQVKMRVWPPGGPSGAWTTNTTEQLHDSSQFNYHRSLGTFQALGAGAQDTILWGEDTYQQAATNALAAAQENLLSKQGQAFSFEPGDTAAIAAGQVTYAAQSFFDTGTLGHGYKATAEIQDYVGFVEADPSAVNPTTPAGAGNDPREIWRESFSRLRLPGGAAGPVVGDFAGWSGDFRVTYSTSDSAGSVYDASNSKGWLVGPAVVKQFSSTDVNTTYVFRTGGEEDVINPGDQGSTLPLTSYIPVVATSASFAVAARPPGTSGELPPPARGAVPVFDPNTGTNGYAYEGTGTLQVLPHSLLFAVSFPVGSFEYFDPTLPWRQPRFFVKDYEGDWRPVGFGKPSSDTSRFHVWTPVGWYVECLDGETYTNAHPLKVKLYDGTWDTVAHMRPL